MNSGKSVVNIEYQYYQQSTHLKGRLGPPVGHVFELLKGFCHFPVSVPKNVPKNVPKECPKKVSQKVSQKMSQKSVPKNVPKKCPQQTWPQSPGRVATQQSPPPTAVNQLPINNPNHDHDDYNYHDNYDYHDYHYDDNYHDGDDDLSSSPFSRQ